MLKTYFLSIVFLNIRTVVTLARCNYIILMFYCSIVKTYFRSIVEN